MGLAHSPKVVTDGLVFYTDMNNTNKSWKGAPTTNSVTNADVMSGWTNYYRTIASSTFITDFGTTGYRFINQPSWNGIWKLITIPTTGTYTFSASFRYFGGSANNNGATVYIAGYGGVDSAVVIDKSKVGVWQNVSITLNCTNTSFYFYLISYGGVDNGTGNPDFSSWEVTMPQAEAGTFATPFVNGTRSNTQAILELTGRNTVTATSLTYASNNTFSFDGVDDLINAGNNAILNVGNNITVNAWVFIGSTASYQPIVSKVVSGFTLGWELANSSGALRATLRPAPIDIASGALTINSWNMTTMTFNGTTLSLYLNGVFQTSSTGGSVTLNSTQDMYIGSRIQGNYFNGNIPSVQIYNRALTAAEVLQNFNAIRGRYGI